MVAHKISEIKHIIEKDKNTDGDYWLNVGNEMIYKILDTFNESDWKELEKDLINFKDAEHSIFARAILHYDENRIVDIDHYQLFFKSFILLKDYEDCDCLLFDMMYIENIKNPDLELFNNIKSKIKLLEDSGFATNEDILHSAYNSIEKAIKNF
ncbi:hypothetical protein [Chryseobacterium jejuense]|uniref:Uncharacterized protein n=1 Tax=Chryseobacterium jejuense TaxID=445960 RepID=A0A2X2WS91_CHRJE|nr:hypothetical protein [Chryseobacterium jejuense]SDJ57131.1 hypothetical protein SAMN05421542_3844 [Chryseobacterium jejuense]SQB46162.1 Uncharacterised protein [Chryseobacterium jejuense]